MATTPKVIADPIYGIIDVRPVLRMVETEEFQALGDKRQLGMDYLIFPSATHTRKAHSLGAYHATRELADRWIKRRFINRKEGDALAGYALYHDIGHPALSHVTEPLCPKPPVAARRAARGAQHEHALSMNSAWSLAIIRQLKKTIAACGIDFALLEKMAEHSHPLHQAVSDKNLGTEKLDYLERDGLFTILSKPVGVDYLREHIYFIDGSLAIDEKVVDNAIEMQNFYLKIYKNVYLRKASVIAQRMVQKMVHHCIASGEISPSDLVTFTDSELIGALRFSEDPLVAELYSLLRGRELFREAIVLRPSPFAHPETRAGKHIAVIKADKKTLRTLAANPSFDSRNQEKLEEMESAVAGIAGIPEEAVLIVPVNGADRFEAQDIKIYEGPGKKLSSLKARYPAHFKNIEEVAQTYLAFRVCTLEKYRAWLAEPRMARRIVAFLMR